MLVHRDGGEPVMNMTLRAGRSGGRLVRQFDPVHAG